jgi:nucleoid DNA-binding protein
VKINQIIKELLLSNDTVVIPELGTFVTQYQPASIIEKDGTIVPPTKLVTFNPKIKTDSTNLLENFISANQGIDFVSSKKQIEEFVKASEAKIKMKGEVELDGVGILFNDSNDKIAFKQISNESLLIQNYGMSSVTIPEATEKQPITSNKKVVTKNKKTVTVKKSGKTLRRILIAVPFIALLVLFILYYQNILNWGNKVIGKIFNKAIKEQTDNNLSDNIDESDITNDELIIDTTEVNDKDTTQNVTSDDNNDDNKINKDENKLKDENISNVTEINLGDSYKKYYLIVGSFNNKLNAQIKVDELTTKGYTTEILTNDPTRFRVSIGGFNKVDDAIEQYKKFVIKYESKDIWMLRNK